jgi:hypothetical protein
MPLPCPQCSQVNFDQATSCIQCGFQLPATDRAKRSFSRLPAINKVSSPGLSSLTPVPFPPQSQGESLPPPQNPPFFSSPAMQEPVMQTVATQEPVAPPLAASGTMPSAFSLERGLGSLRRAFAGYGKVITHHSWLLNDQHAQANEVRRAINEMIAQSGLNGLQVVPEKLTDQSLVSEQREFTRIKRKLPTIFIYVTPAGRDLYISRATAVKPAISMLRTAVFVLVLAALSYQFFGQLASLTAASHVLATAGQALTPASSPSGHGSPDASLNPIFSALGIILLASTLLTCLDGPLIALLIAIIVYSLISWLLEKDFWVLLRPNFLNDFQRDDIALLEQVTDDIMRAAMKQLRLDANKIVAPAQGYQPPRKIRFI